MNAIKHIALMWGIVLTCLGLLAGSALAQSTKTLFFDIPDGDSAFLLDQSINQAWWITGECKRVIPLERSDNRESLTILSEKLSENVMIGSRQIQLQQQFRFNLAPSDTSVDVYSSIRGGWSSIPVEVNMTCHQDPICKARMELPEC